MKKHLFVVLLAAALCMLCVASVSAVSYTYETEFTNPVASGADPFVLYDEGTYYLYATNDGSNGYIAYTSTDLVNWHAAGYVLRDEDVQLDSSNGYAGLWAPEVMRDGDTYYMVYTAQEHIGIATAESPLGPFKDKSGWLFEDKAIDGNFFRDDDGKLYLYFVSTGAWDYNGYTTTTGNNIWGGEFDLETCTFIQTPKLLIRWSAGEWNVNEGPEMIKHDGVYHLTYSKYGYGSPSYSVCDATSSSPLGEFTKQNTVLITNDPNRDDPDNNLYGTGHHCFVRMPDDPDKIAIVYHAHRSGKASPLVYEQNSSATNEQLRVETRRVCIDEAWFDEDGVLRAGDRNNVGHPTLSAATAPTGASATRTVELDDNFAALATLPTVYVAMKAGLDTNAGTKAAPFRSLDRAYKALPNGGTIVLLEAYDMTSASLVEYGITTMDACYVAPAVNGPVMIRGAFSAVPIEFKFWSISSDTYLENLELRPRLTGTLGGGYSVIECGQNNVVIGENVSCASRPNSPMFPVLVGGYWQYGTAKTTPAYVHFNTVNRPDSMLTTDKAYSLTVLGGTWEHIYVGSLKSTKYVENSAPNATLTQGSGASIRPAKVTDVKVELSTNGPVISFAAVDNAVKYRITDGAGNFVGFTDTTSFTDTSYVVGTTKSYKVAGYVNGACIGDASASVTVTSYGDMNGDGEITITDALLLLTDILDGTKDVSLANVLWQLKYIATK